MGKGLAQHSHPLLRQFQQSAPEIFFLSLTEEKSFPARIFLVHFFNLAHLGSKRGSKLPLSAKVLQKSTFLRPQKSDFISTMTCARKTRRSFYTPYTLHKERKNETDAKTVTQVRIPLKLGHQFRFKLGQ
jgi:hypothetical protein